MATDSGLLTFEGMKQRQAEQSKLAFRRVLTLRGIAPIKYYVYSPNDRRWVQKEYYTATNLQDCNIQTEHKLVSFEDAHMAWARQEDGSCSSRSSSTSLDDNFFSSM